MKYKTFDVQTYIELLTGLMFTKQYDLDMNKGKCVLSIGVTYSIIDIYRIIYN